MQNELELRCDGGVLHGIVIGGLLEVKCNHPACTRGNRNCFVLHRIDPVTGQVKDTIGPYSNPPRGVRNARS